VRCAFAWPLVPMRTSPETVTAKRLMETEQEIEELKAEVAKLREMLGMSEDSLKAQREKLGVAEDAVIKRAKSARGRFG